MKKSHYIGSTHGQLKHETIGAAFDRICQQYPHNQALVLKHQGIRWTYAQYQKAVNRLATGLLAIGVKPGDRVGIWSPNGYQWCLTQYATAKIGAILVCINPAYRTEELKYALNTSACHTLITAEQFKSSDYIAMLQTLAPELSAHAPGDLKASQLPNLVNIVHMGDKHLPGMYRFSDICERGGEGPHHTLASLQASLNAKDPINIQFTSGTTGSPKGATLSHFNILNNAESVAAGMKLTEVDRLCIPVPLYHCFGMVMGNLACLVKGASAVFPGDVFDPAATLQTVEEERCTALHGVPTMFIAELDLPDFDRFELSTLRTGVMAGAPCPEPVMKRVIRDMHMKDITIMYGQTETSPVNHMTAIGDTLANQVGTVGRCAPHQEVKLIDREGNTVAIGEKGELCCRGYAVMLGYWSDKQRTEETIDAEGWLHSGDLATMDSAGYVKIVGRLKDMIIRGGENISPKDIECFLMTHPAIKDVHVFGVPDARLGEQVCAWIVTKAGETLDEDAIKAFCDDKIAHYKIPQQISFVDDFPMTVTGKVQKYKMREKQVRIMAES